MQRSKNKCVPFLLVLILVNSAAALTVYGENETKKNTTCPEIYIFAFLLSYSFGLLI